jgi:hypothetical protein
MSVKKLFRKGFPLMLSLMGFQTGKSDHRDVFCTESNVEVASTRFLHLKLKKSEELTNLRETDVDC